MATMAHVSCETRPKTEAVRPPDTGRRQPVSGMVSEFASETSLHGVKYTLQDCIAKPRRLFWVVVVLAQLTGFVIIVESHIRYIHSRPILTKVTNRYMDRMPFPGVTVCSHLPDAINLTLEALADLGTNALESSDLRANALKSSEPGNTLLTSSQILNKALFPVVSQEGVNKLNQSGVFEKTQQLLQTELIQQCVFASTNCSNYVRKFVSEELQPRLCYTVNGFVDDKKNTQTLNNSSPGNENEQILPVLESLAPGMDGGLTLTINVQDTVKTGVQIFLHEPHEKFSPGNSDVLKLTPGTENYVRVKVKQSTYLPSPYKAFGDRECLVMLEDFRHPLVPHGRYTLRACQDACHGRWLKTLCGIDIAGDILNPPSYIECVNTTGVALHNTSFSVATCDCPLPCQEIDYTTTLSTSLDVSIPENLRLSVLSVNIHFDRMRIESTEQVQGYTRDDVFASIGGQMGLFLGASLITLVEVAEFVFRWLCRGIFRCSHK